MRDRNADEKATRFAMNALLEILRTETDPGHGLKKTEMQELLRKRYNITMVRGTFYNKFNDLVAEGHPIERAEGGGWYLAQNGLTDGELRILIDTVLYSDMLPEKYSADMIKKLADMGSRSFKDYVKTRSYTAGYINKNGNMSIVMTVEDIQRAIYEKKQISCNCVSYNEYLKPENIYDEDIIINPYELAFSGGRYYLVCAKENEDELTILRVDRLRDVRILKSSSHEIEKLVKIRKNSSIQKYIDSQPDLKGGTTEIFTLLCYGEAIDEVYDTFGSRIRLRDPVDENYNDPDTVTISVETTRESIKSWAIMHADKVVIISPKDVREEIKEALTLAQHIYSKSGKPAVHRMFMAKSLEEAIHEMKAGKRKLLRYRGHSKSVSQSEKIDLGKVEVLPEIVSLSLSFCDISDSHLTEIYPDIRYIVFTGVKFDAAIFDFFPDLMSITIVHSDINSLDFLRNYSALRKLILYDCENITDFSALYELDGLDRFGTDNILFTEAESEKLRERFPDCEIKIREPFKKRERK